MEKASNSVVLEIVGGLENSWGNEGNESTGVVGETKFVRLELNLDAIHSFALFPMQVPPNSLALYR